MQLSYSCKVVNKRLNNKERTARIYVGHFSTVIILYQFDGVVHELTNDIFVDYESEPE